MKPVAFISDADETIYCPNCYENEPDFFPLYGDPDRKGLIGCDGCGSIYDSKLGEWL